jgi:DNA replication and repair protein RecF
VVVTRLRLRNFRTYASADVALGPRLTVVHGRNGAGKTNLLEGLYFGCTGRSCRTSNEREIVRFGEQVTRVEVSAESDTGAHELAVGFQPGEPKQLRADGAPVLRMLDVDERPLACVFLPDRLELVKGTPGLRRAHLDAVVVALWPTRRGTRAGYAQALAQRNALLARVNAGHASPSSLDAWDQAIAHHGIALMADRSATVDLLQPRFAELAAELGLDGEASVAYRPRSGASTETELAAELAERREQDLRRGFTGHGPHRDELVLKRAGRELRSYGSQGQQRLGLLALLLAEREVIARERGAPPLMLLDDVMSELDAGRRERLVGLLLGRGQSLITTTDPSLVPAEGPGIVHLEIADGVAHAPREAQAA